MTWCIIILSCNRAVVAVGDQLRSDRQPIGDRSATGWRLYLERLFMFIESLQHFGDRSATDRRLVGDWKLYRNCLRPLQLTSRRPVGNLSASSKNLSTIDLVAERFHLQQPNPPCDQIVPASFCNRSANSRRPPCYRHATSLQPPEILVARRSPTGCKLCVTGALLYIVGLEAHKIYTERHCTRRFRTSDLIMRGDMFKSWNDTQTFNGFLLTCN